MNIKKYIVGISAVAVVTSIGWLSVEALSINNANFDKGLPIFKTIFFRSEGKDSINGATNAEGVRIDNGGIYTAPTALPGAGGNVLKLNGASSQVFIDPVQSANIANDSISNIKIMDNSIINSNFADLAITNEQIQNNTITKTKFDSAIVWPTGGTMYITNNVCNPNNAIVSTNNGTATCALLPTGATTTLPNCSPGQQPVYSGGSWTCITFSISAGGGDLYRTGSTGSWIANSNPGNVGVGLGATSPAHTLTVSGNTNEFEVQGEAEEQVYCYASDTWVPVSVYNPAVCAGCSAGLSYNSISGLCEANSCIGSGAADGVCGFANGQSYGVAPWKFLCSAGTATPVAGSGPWTWDCLGSNGGANVSCSANVSATCAGDVTIQGQGTVGDPMYAHYEGVYHSETIRLVGTATNPTTYTRSFQIVGGTGPQDSTQSATNVPQNLTDLTWVVTPSTIGGQPLCFNGTPITSSDSIYIWNRSNLSDTINDININGLAFIAVNNGTFPIAGGSSLDGAHGDINANDMDYDITSPIQQCMYVFVNNETDATLGGCNPSGYVSQTQIPVGIGNGTIFAPAINQADRIDIVMCGGICN